MPEISVIVPVYNVEKYLRECLDSVLKQTFSDFEVICVNDGSTDGSPAILAEYAAKDLRIKTVTQENSGLSDARNTGMALAQGKYLYFLDSDDWIEPDTLEICRDTAEKNQLDELIFNRIEFYENEDMENMFRGNGKSPFRTTAVMDGKTLFVSAMQDGTFRSPVPFRFLRREFLVENGLHFYSKLIHEDDLFSIRCAFLSKRSMYIDKYFYHQRRRGNSITTVKASFQRFISCAIIHREFSALLLDCIGTEAEKALALYMDQNLFRANELYQKLEKAEFCAEYKKYPELQSFYGFLPLSDVLNQKSYREGAKDKTAEITSGLTWRSGHILLWLPLKIMQLLKGRKNG